MNRKLMAPLLDHFVHRVFVSKVSVNWGCHSNQTHLPCMLVKGVFLKNVKLKKKRFFLSFFGSSYLRKNILRHQMRNCYTFGVILISRVFSEVSFVVRFFFQTRFFETVFSNFVIIVTK